MPFSFVVGAVPVIPIKTMPSQHSEMSSQLLFGERALVLKQENDWLYIESHWDQYEGWIHKGSVNFITQKEYKKFPKTLTGIGINKLILENGFCLLSPGSDLFGMKNNQFPWLKSSTIKYKGSKVVLKKNNFDAENILRFTLAFLGAGYQWGGRSLMGIDCSGLSQMVYKMLNISLPRDANEQVKIGFSIDFLIAAQCGDLAFFDNEEGAIIHVGILLDPYTIIHASQQSGCVVIDDIDQGGIISRKQKKRIGHLRIIKRIV
ncbi:MAG TPA: C40 family peptidase [Edaphocola sp.]|nr:C40 family peptidase [Edaphocola sp.]